MEYEDGFNSNINSEEIIEECSKYFYAGEEQSHNASVNMLVTNTIMGYNGFDDRLLEYRNDHENFNMVIDESDLVCGHILIGFKDYHAMVFVVISDDEYHWLASSKEFSYLENDYKKKSLSDLYISHIRFVHQHSEDYMLEWKKIPSATLESYERVFYICNFTDVHFLEIQAVALSALPAYYSTFYSDCLEFCKTFAKNFIKTFDLDCVEPERIDALAITGLKIEKSSRRNLMSAVSGNRAVNSSTNGNIFVFVACVLGVIVGHIIMKLVDKYVF